MRISKKFNFPFSSLSKNHFFNYHPKPFMQFVPDVEGDLSFFKKQVRESQVVKFVDQSESRIQFKSTDSSLRFVFGGDLCDRGDDIAIANMLVQLKQENEDRVTLLLGNRDLNKVRFANELPEDPGVIFSRAVSAVPTPPFATKSYAEFLSERQDTPVETLKWILTCTMGAPAAFECRRKELAKLMGSANISDQSVYNSFRQSVEAGGFMRNYLSLAQLGDIIGDTLFVHGGVTESNCGYVPNGFAAFEKESSESIAKRYDNPHQWIDALNDWYQSAFQRWIADSAKSAEPYHYSNQVASAPLQHMAVGPGSIYKGKSVIVGNFLKGRRTPSPVSPSIASYLQAYGINRIVSGHKPCGDTPLFLFGTTQSVASNAIQVFTCDTLYGNREAYHPTTGARISGADPRGKSYATVHISFDEVSKTSQVNIKGSTGFGQAYQKEIAFPQLADADKFFGRVLLIEGKEYIVRLNPITDAARPYTLTYLDESSTLKYRTISKDELVTLENSGAFITRYNNESLSKIM